MLGCFCGSRFCTQIGQAWVWLATRRIQTVKRETRTVRTKEGGGASVVLLLAAYSSSVTDLQGRLQLGARLLHPVTSSTLGGCKLTWRQGAIHFNTLHRWESRLQGQGAIVTLATKLEAVDGCEVWLWHVTQNWKLSKGVRCGCDTLHRTGTCYTELNWNVSTGRGGCDMLSRTGMCQQVWGVVVTWYTELECVNRCGVWLWHVNRTGSCAQKQGAAWILGITDRKTVSKCKI